MFTLDPGNPDVNRWVNTVKVSCMNAFRELDRSAISSRILKLSHAIPGMEPNFQMGT